VMRRVLFIVENLPSPFDRRVWQEATTLEKAGYQVSIICPTGKGYEKKYEVISNIHIFRHGLPIEASGLIGYIAEYSAALFWEFVLAWKVYFTRGFDVIHACNPPDTIFLIGLFFKLFGKKFVFDHHDINPELYIAKFGRKDLMYKLMLMLELMTFKTATVSIATNESYKKIAIERGGMDAGRVYIVRSGPDLARMKIIEPNIHLRNGRKYMVGYVGVMGRQEGIDLLLKSISYIVHHVGRKDIQFGLVGGGTELDAMQSYAKALEINEFVTFTGRIPDKEMLEMLNTADVCVNPDIANDMNDKSTMNKIMEYMALSKPIVQFDLTEGRFSAQQASLYAKKNDTEDFAEKILELIDDAGKRHTMGRYGYQRIINEFEWKYEVPKLLSAYDAVFDGRV